MYYLDHLLCSKEAFLKTGDLKASLFSKDAKTKNTVTTVVQTVVTSCGPRPSPRRAVVPSLPWDSNELETYINFIETRHKWLSTTSYKSYTVHRALMKV